jgi:hypothetical protein
MDIRSDSHTSFSQASMSINRRRTLFPGDKNYHALLPKPRLVEASKMPRLPSVSRRSSGPTMRVSLKNGDNPWTSYARLSRVEMHAGQGKVAQRRGQLSQLVFIKQVDSCTQEALQRLRSAIHPNVLPFTAAYLYKQSIYLVYNYSPVMLQELVRWYLSTVEIATVCNAVAQGLEYLHRELDMVHGNLDTCTVVVGNDGQVKIGEHRQVWLETC